MVQPRSAGGIDPGRRGAHGIGEGGIETPFHVLDVPDQGLALRWFLNGVVRGSGSGSGSGIGVTTTALVGWMTADAGRRSRGIHGRFAAALLEGGEIPTTTATTTDAWTGWRWVRLIITVTIPGHAVQGIDPQEPRKISIRRAVVVVVPSPADVALALGGRRRHAVRHRRFAIFLADDIIVFVVHVGGITILVLVFLATRTVLLSTGKVSVGIVGRGGTVGHCCLILLVLVLVLVVLLRCGGAEILF